MSLLYKLRILILFCLIICLLLGTNLLYYIYRPEPEFAVALSVKHIQKGETVHEMDRLPENYNCRGISDLEDKILTICERKKAIIRHYGELYVRGYYLPQDNTIWLDKDLQEDSVVHELVHWLDTQYAGRDKETRAYAFQHMYNKVFHNP